LRNGAGQGAEIACVSVYTDSRRGASEALAEDEKVAGILLPGGKFC
jgi:hypothetical protein